ncbi:MAG: DUF2927 domain-containing protein [Pseudomonadota bacterium]
MTRWFSSLDGGLLWRGALLVACMVFLSACQSTVSSGGTGTGVSGQGADTTTGPVSPESAALSRYYGRLQADLRAQDLMRTGGGGVDTPFTESDLLRNFERIAFYDEYQRNGGLARSEEGPGRLKKWRVPIHVAVEFGDTVAPDIRRREAERVAAFTARLARITGHPIRMSAADPNFVVMIMGNDDAEQARDRALELVPSIASSNLVFFSRLPRSIQCFVLAAGYESEYEYRVAVAYIRAENTDLQRLSCIHEEMSQGLGLTNDSPRARPSIFNDDEEFALLTTHDEVLLRALYDDRLRPGMTLEQARPVLQESLKVPPGAGSS